MCQLKLTLCLCDNCGQLRYRDAVEYGPAPLASSKNPGEAGETERKSSIGQSGGGHDERDEDWTTAGAIRAGGSGGARLVEILLWNCGKGRADIAKAKPPH
jgi:hypothetical protein